MSIRKRGNRWEIRVRIGGGERIERTLPPGATRADAREFEASLRRAHIDTAVGRKQRYSIDQAIEQWRATGAEKLKSWHKELRYKIDVLAGYTKDTPLEELVNVAERFKKVGLQQGKHPATINRYLSILRRIGNLAERWGWTDLPLGRRIRMLPENTDRHVYLSAVDVERLAKAAGPAADMVRFAALSGLRLGELLAIQPHQIQLSGNSGILILGTTTKSGLPRGVPLPAEALKIAAKALPWALTRKQLRDRWEAARIAVGRPDVRWHDLRHTYASWLVQAGESLPVIGSLLGHSSPAVTQRYAHLAPGNLSSAVAKLPRLGAGRGKPTKKKAA